MTPFHPIVVHFPIVLLIVAGVFYVLHFFLKNHSLDKIGFFLHAAGLLACIAAILTGDYAESQLIQTHDMHELVEEHEMQGMITTYAFGVLAVWAFLRHRANLQLEKIVFTVVFWLGIGFMGVAADHGGKLVYEMGAGVAPMEEQLREQRNLEQGMRHEDSDAHDDHEYDND